MTLQELFDESVSLIEEDLEKAIGGFHYLLNNDPNSSALVFYIGTCEMKRGNFGAAVNLLKLSTTMKGKPFPEAWNNLGWCYHEQGLVDKADKCFQKSLELKPDSADIHNNVASCYVNNGTPDKAIEILKKGLELDPKHNQIPWNIGLAYLEKGMWVEGWKGYDHGLESGHRTRRKYHKDVETPLWKGEKGHTVVIYGEQGIGDETMFASILPDAIKDADVIFDCHPRLVNIFRNSFPDIPIFGTRKEKELTWCANEKIDSCLPIGSLGGMYRKKLKDFPKKPYIKADDFLVSKIKERLNTKKPIVVIHWKGGTAKTNKDYRSIGLKEWKPILEKDCEFVSLQYTENAPEVVKMVNEEYGVNIHHWEDVVADMDWQTAALQASDLVISVNTSIVHISGALGKECWCLTPKKCAWRYGLKDEQMAWYGSVKQYRETNGWTPIIEQVAKDLEEKLC